MISFNNMLFNFNIVVRIFINFPLEICGNGHAFMRSNMIFYHTHDGLCHPFLNWLLLVSPGAPKHFRMQMGVFCLGGYLSGDPQKGLELLVSGWWWPSLGDSCKSLNDGHHHPLINRCHPTNIPHGPHSPRWTFPSELHLGVHPGVTILRQG